MEHGQARPDPYRWMHTLDHPELQQLIREAKVQERMFFQPITALKQALSERMLALTNEDRKQVPWKEGQFKYFFKHDAGQQYSNFYRFPSHKPEQETLMLDNNALAAGKDYCEVNDACPSPDGRCIVYLIDEDGSQTMSIAVVDTTAMNSAVTSDTQLSPLRETSTENQIKTFSSIIWTPDAKGFYYAPLNDRKNPDSVWFYDRDTHQRTKVYHETDSERWVSIGKTEDEKLILISSTTTDSTKYNTLPMGATDAHHVQLFHAPEDHLTLDLDGDEKHFFGLVSINGSNHQLIRFDRHITQLDLESAETLIPADEKNELAWVNLQAEHVIIGKRIDGVMQIHVYDKHDEKGKNTQNPEQTSQPVTGKTHQVADLSQYGLHNGRAIFFPDTQYSISLSRDTYQDDKIRLCYEGPTTPYTAFLFDCKTNQLSVIQQDQFDNFTPSDYCSEMRFATAQDGTAIPVSLFYHKDTPRDGSAPLKLSAYGAYGLHDDESYSPAQVSLADKGMVVVTAQVRGGGIYGRQWYEAGKMKQKLNTFTDTIDVAKWLITENYSKPNKMVLYGGSAGGLPVGYALNNAPHLFSTVIADVPFVDALTDMFDEQLPLTQEEWLEWGNPKIKSEYDYMKSYSPIDNLRKGEYPATMIIGGVNDGQVPFRETAKLFAHLQHYKTDDRPLVFHVNNKSGHHGDAGLYSSIAESALKNAFALWMASSPEVTAPKKRDHSQKTNANAHGILGHQDRFV
jgi:oligopeptidase B